VNTLSFSSQDSNPILKKCTGPCGRMLDATFDYFYHSGITKDGLYYKCKKCVNDFRRENYSKKDNSKQRRKQKLRKKYGITIEQYDCMFAKQNGLCAVCKQPETAKQKGKIRALAVDHCHSTGMVRGLLCKTCNTALGNMKENPDLIRALADYVE